MRSISTVSKAVWNARPSSAANLISSTQPELRTSFVQLPPGWGWRVESLVAVLSSRPVPLRTSNRIFREFIGTGLYRLGSDAPEDFTEGLRPVPVRKGT